jgi:hypothetical protein
MSSNMHVILICTSNVILYSVSFAFIVLQLIYERMDVVCMLNVGYFNYKNTSKMRSHFSYIFCIVNF